MLPAVLLVAAYLLGSIPFSFIVAKLFSGGDIRELGSGNVGATNVMRSAGKLPGILALILDLAKGYGAVKLAELLMARPEWPFHPTMAQLATGDLLVLPSLWIGLAGLVAVLGHIFPVWLRFQGGKGVATGTGVFLALDPLATLAGAILFLVVVAVTRYVSVASMAAAAAMPLLLRFFVHESFWIVVASIFISVIIILKHRGNILRLAEGSERKLGQGRDNR